MQAPRRDVRVQEKALTYCGADTQSFVVQSSGTVCVSGICW